MSGFRCKHLRSARARPRDLVWRSLEHCAKNAPGRSDCRSNGSWCHGLPVLSLSHASVLVHLGFHVLQSPWQTVQHMKERLNFDLFSQLFYKLLNSLLAIEQGLSDMHWPIPHQEPAKLGTVTLLHPKSPKPKHFNSQAREQERNLKNNKNKS